MKALYYRGEIRVDKKTEKEIKKYFTNKHYNWFKEVEVHDEFDCLPELAPIFYTIQCNQELNERSEALIERIKKTKPKGYTPSSSYYSYSVESNLMLKLVNDARRLLIAEEGHEVNTYHSVHDFYRYYDMEDLWLHNSDIHQQLKKARTYCANITKPEVFYDWISPFSGKKTFGISSATSSYKLYHVATKDTSLWRLDDAINTIYNKFPYLGKLYDTYDGYVQIYVYDHFHRHWAVNNVIHELKERGMLELRHKLNKKEKEYAKDIKDS